MLTHNTTAGYKGSTFGRFESVFLQESPINSEFKKSFFLAFSLYKIIDKFYSAPMAINFFYSQNSDVIYFLLTYSIPILQFLNSNLLNNVSTMATAKISVKTRELYIFQYVVKILKITPSFFQLRFFLTGKLQRQVINKLGTNQLH
jgi:predicted neutral ceramidase superfamily lipid hydrolase